MPSYPLLGPNVQSIFEYIKFEIENIHLGEFDFDILDFFGVPSQFNYNIDFFSTPVIDDDNTVSPGAYGIISTCDFECLLSNIDVVFTYKDHTLISGPAVRVFQDDKDNAILYAALYNARDHLLILVKYVNQPLTRYGTKLAVLHNITLALNDVIKLRATGTSYSVFINCVLVIGPIVDTEIDDTNKCIGVIEIQLAGTPVLKNIITGFLSIYLTRVFYYCLDGISISKPLVPAVSDVNTTVNETSVILKSGQNGDRCYGFGYAQGFTDTDVALLKGRGYYIEFQFKYYITPSGNPISGLAFLIDESKADPDDFTGWVAIINKKLGKIQLAYYLNESLSDLPDPTHIVAEVTKTLDNNTLVKIVGSFAADVSNTLWSINVLTKQPTDVLYINDIIYVGANQLPIGDQVIVRRARTNYGLAWIGNGDIGNHSAYWSGDITEQYALIN